MSSVPSESDLKVIRIPVPSPTLLLFTATNSYLIGNNQESVLIDAGYDQQETKSGLERAIMEHGLATPKSIILTHSHPDHAPGVRQLLDWSPAVYCHQLEKQAILTAISPWCNLSFLTDGDVFKVADEEITIIHAPGHSSGQLNLYIPSQQILIAGDNIVAEGTSWIGPPDGDMTDYLQTLRRLKELTISKIGPGHGEWVTNPYEHIEFVLNRRLQREGQIMALLNEHQPLTTTRLTEMIYPENIHPSIFEVAKRTTEAHLIKLMKDGGVIQQDSHYTLKS
jgi:endoribonuclease LACTB2